MSDTTLLSIVIPVFNAAEDLHRSLGSVPEHEHLEVVLVDNGSTDESLDVITQWARQRKRVLVLQCSTPGPGAARSMGLAACSGIYVTFLDADDELVWVGLKQCCDAADLNHADVVIGAYHPVHAMLPPSQRRLTPGNQAFRWVSPFRVLLSRAAVWGKVYRRRFLVDHMIDFEWLRSADDVLFTVDVAASRPKTLESDVTAYLYFVHPHDQLTSDPEYFVQGIDSLALLKSRFSIDSPLTWALATYAGLSGLVHIWRRLEWRDRRRGIQAIAATLRCRSDGRPARQHARTTAMR